MSFRHLGYIVDIDRVERRSGTDASRWAGVVTLRRPRGAVVVTANYVGAEGSADGALVDFSGDSVRACRFAEGIADRMADEIARRLGDPCSRDERIELARAGWYDAA